jgi:hypothetical protein
VKLGLASSFARSKSGARAIGRRSIQAARSAVAHQAAPGT